MPSDEFLVTPWEVEGNVDYNKLTALFGTQPIDDAILARFKRLTGSIPPMLRRQVFFSHRDFNWILDRYEAGEKFVLYTGRGPSGHTHLGHLMPWIFTKYLQDAFDADLYFQMTDDEKFLQKDELSASATRGFSYDNALDLIALGFDPEKTRIFLDTEYARTLYPIALEVAKRVTFSAARAVFGFDSSTNIGMVFFTSMQSAPAFLPAILSGRNVPVLIPCAIDQDPHFRITRDVAPKMGYYKPALIHSRFFPSLLGLDKMSASIPETSIFTTDSPEQARTKIANAFTGGRTTVQEQRDLGGVPDICAVYQYSFYLFEQDDKRAVELREECLRGARACGECKNELADKVVQFLKHHQAAREQAQDRIEDFIIRDCQE
ncbi:MAG: tryptophan--tRNA ligase [Halobacteriota archaeon]|jgi:tryptophanyl-tRNA synthetase